MRKTQQHNAYDDHQQHAATHQQLLMQQNSNGNGGVGGSESYSSTSSFTESYSDSSDLANWEEYVAENGTLFYAEYTLNAPPHRRMHEKCVVEFARNSSLRTAGKKSATTTTNTRKQQLPKGKQQEEEEQSYKFSHIRRQHNSDKQQQQQQKQLELVITAADRFRFGRRSTAVESILGFRVVPYVDQPECLMVDEFVHDMPAMQPMQSQPIKRGDWFKSLDDIEVRTSNVDELLLQFVEPTKVCLKFQAMDDEAAAAAGGNENVYGGSGGGAAAGNSDLRRIENFAMFAEIFEKLILSETTSSSDAAPSPPPPFLMIILPPECYQHDEHRDSMFVFPDHLPNGNNFLYKSRGSFLTLNAVLAAEMQTKPLSSKLLVNDVEYHVCYRTLNGFLVLFAYAVTNLNHPTQMESNLRSDELIDYMRFALPHLSLEHLAATSSSSSLKLFLYHFCLIQRTRILSSCSSSSSSFEDLLRESRTLPLPKEAQLRIFDALSEMEAMDYRNWNDEPLNTHREFFIHGSVLYYDHYQLATQMPMEMRTRIESFLRCRGIFDFIRSPPPSCVVVKELYVWEEIEQNDAPELGRYFLTICSRSHLILAVVLKIFDAPDLAPDAIIPPSLFYIEEIQETLDHLIACGIESLAMFWSISNKRPEALSVGGGGGVGGEQQQQEKDSNKLENFIKQKLTPSSSGGHQSPSSPLRIISYDEETHLCSSLGGGSSIHSEDDAASRKRLNSTATAADNAAVSDSGSDWDNFDEQNPLHCGGDGGGDVGGGEMQSSHKMTESLWKEINSVVPVKICAGWKNAVYHYVYVDSANATVFCPLKPTMGSSNNNTEMTSFLSEMRKACLIIHNVLQNTKSFRRLLAQETTNSSSQTQTIHQSTTASNRYTGLAAIKEHGMTIHVRGGDSENAIFKGNFIVVGRLFHTPTREIYVCHRPDAPQNLVEMAFRLSFFSVG